MVYSNHLPAIPRFVAYSSSSTTAGGNPTTISVDTASLNPDGFTFSNGGVVLPDGNWFVEAHVGGKATGSTSRTNFDAYLTADGVQVPGSAAVLYLRQTNFGGSAPLAAVVSGGVVVAVEVDRTVGAASGVFGAGFCRLIVYKLP